MNNDELRELLRLTAIALGDGWRATATGNGDILFNKDYTNPRDNTAFLDPYTCDADSRWLEVELGLCIVRYKEEVSAYHPSSDMTVILQVAQFSGMLEATRWAVLQCAAELGAAKEGEK